MGRERKRKNVAKFEERETKERMGNKCRLWNGIRNVEKVERYRQRENNMQ